MKFFNFLILILFGLSQNLGATESRPLNVMAPLTIGDVHNPHSSHSDLQWLQFKNDLSKIKSLGADAVTTDIWWGLVEKQENRFDWSYYDRLVASIEQAGLKWIPILSFHQLGGNVGDDGYVPLPEWIWTKYIGQGEVKDAHSLKYKSEQGNFNSEYVAVWGTPYVLADYRDFMTAFRDHFADKKHLIPEVNISLGPAGELRYPSYNSHDKGTGYKTRGALQAYSDLAVSSFRGFIKHKYVGINAINSAWNTSLKSIEEVYPPSPSSLQSYFFKTAEHFSTYGKDFFDWYNASLIEHGQLLLQTAVDVFNSEHSQFSEVDIGAKLPGVHWRVATDRLAELAAGLIRTSYADWYSEQSSFGYADTLRIFHSLNTAPLKSRVVLHFTALEMNDGRDGEEVGSKAKSLVQWIGSSAEKLNIPLKGENALAEELENPEAWLNIQEALTHSGYDGFTVLRLNSLVRSTMASASFRSLHCSLLLLP